MIVDTPRTLPTLSPFDPATALTLQCVCKLGLVPGHDGRRIDVTELASWAQIGFRPTADGPAFLFPAVQHGDELWTTPDWCRTWVRFLARRNAPTSNGRNRRKRAPMALSRSNSH